MKLLKLNAILIIISLIVCSCAETEETLENLKKTNLPNLIDFKILETPQKDSQIKNEISKIMSYIKTGNLKEFEIKKKLSDKLNEAKKVSQQVHQKQEIIKKIMKKREENEKKNKLKLVKEEEKNKELELLKAVGSKIKEMKEREIKDYEEKYNRQISLEKEKTNQESKKMIQALTEQEKNNSYGSCLNTRLQKFDDMFYVEGLCNNYYENNEKVKINFHYKF
jgi:type I site-specific restriction-modification system R (restriction) subunit